MVQTVSNDFSRGTCVVYQQAIGFASFSLSEGRTKTDHNYENCGYDDCERLQGTGLICVGIEDLVGNSLTSV